MNTIDYTKYTLKELLDCQKNTDKDRFPENWLALNQELSSRDIQTEPSPEVLVAIEKEALKIIGYFQLLGSALITYFLIVSSNHSTINISVGIAFILLNLVSGVTAIKEMYSWYWLSILNQGLQIINLSMGKYIINYSAIGGIYTGFKWGEGEYLMKFSFNLTPGYAFYQLSEELSKNFILIDVLAVVFFVALVTVKENKLNPKNN